MLIHGAIGDAYGAPFEFADRKFISQNNSGKNYHRKFRTGRICNRYTDDTQMAIALAELMIENQEWTPLNVANKFVECFKRDVRGGYARRFFGLLQEVNSGQELLNKIIPKSERNGAVMRVYPLGLFRTEKEILEKAKIQAEVTHKTEKAVLGAQAIALASHFFFYKKGMPNQLLEYLSGFQNYQWQGNWNSKVNIDAIETTEAVLTVLINGKNLKDMLIESVNFGGDTDTVASLVLAIGSLSTDYETNLPSAFYEELENGKFGRDFIKSLDSKLIGLSN